MSKPRGEGLAYQQLTNQGFDVYLPMCPTVVRRRGRNLTDISPMFLRYLFVRPSHQDQGITSVRSAQAVQQLVRFGTEFAQAPDLLVLGIRALEAGMCEDLESGPFRAGDEVEIAEGPFAGIRAKGFTCAENRVLLLDQLLGYTRN